MKAPLDFIDGRFETPAVPLGKQVCNANDGKPLFEQRACGEAALEKALATAQRLHERGALRQLSAERRAELLDALAESLEKRTADMAHADALTTGVVISTCTQLAELAPATFRAAAAVLRAASDDPCLSGAFGEVVVERLPLGPAALVAPWNAPAAIACHKAASALAAGCPVLLKPSEWAPGSGVFMAEAAAETEWPRGAFQVVNGAAASGAALVGDPRIRAVSFTGGLAGGRAVAALCAHDMKPVQLELGGNNPLIVLPGADLSAAAEGVLEALTQLGGQWCRGLGRLFVQQGIEDALLERVWQKLAGCTVGSSLDPKSRLGPLAHEAHRDRVAEAARQLCRAGGEAHAPAAMPEAEGWFYPPTLIRGVAPADAEEEIFGPVATVHVFDSVDEVLAAAAQNPYGLAAYVFGPETEAEALGARLHTGLVKYNGVGLTGLHPLAPRPCWGLSGLGVEGAVETLELFQGLRVRGAAGPAPRPS